MRTDQLLTTLAVLCFGFTSESLAQQKSDEIKQRVLTQAQSRSADDYAFTRTIRTEGTQAGKTEKKVSVEKYDPSKPAEARWTLVSVDGAKPSPESLDEFRKEAAKRRVVPGYHRLANYFGASATASTGSGGCTLFQFASLPKDSVTVMGTDVSQNASAEALVSDSNGMPYVEQARISVRPMRLKLVMKLAKFETTYHYRIGPDGRPVLNDATSDLAGSGLGQEGSMHTVATYSDYRAVRGQ